MLRKLSEETGAGLPYIEAITSSKDCDYLAIHIHEPVRRVVIVLETGKQQARLR